MHTNVVRVLLDVATKLGIILFLFLFISLLKIKIQLVGKHLLGEK